MTTTLTDRYIAVVSRNIPSASRADVQAELQASIEDAIQVHMENSVDFDEAEKAALTELGDPAILAASYSDRTLTLIGPRLYLTWWRLLKLLWAIVPTVAMGGVAIGQILAGASLGEIVSSVVSVGLSTVVYVGFWVTVVFAVLERTAGKPLDDAWSVDKLPEIPSEGATRTDVVASLAFLVVGVVAIVWDSLRGLARVGSETMSVLNPALWPGWIIGLLALMGAAAALTIWVHLRGRWTYVHAALNTVLALVFTTAALMLLSRGELVNPALVTFIFTDNGVDTQTVQTLGTLLGVAIGAFAAWGVFDTWLKAYRDSRR